MFELKQFESYQKDVFHRDIDIYEFDTKDYYLLIDECGIADAWEIILYNIRCYREEELERTKLFGFWNLGETYEIGLAYVNKIDKKEMGKYFTPPDVCDVMAKLLLEKDCKYIADVGCGVGNLIIAVLQNIAINQKSIIDYIKSGRIYLYEIDEIALKICLARIDILCVCSVSNHINSKVCDFLDDNVKLPKEAGVICNPPYSVIKEFKSTWVRNVVVEQSRDLYASFFDKIMSGTKSAVIVSPQSYLTAIKFEKLRARLAEEFNGEIYAFDNVPCPLFCGRKHGIFNTNNANGVRAAITSISKGKGGFRITHLIRFTAGQRQQVINVPFLKSKLGRSIQILKPPLKCFKELEPMIERIDRKITLLELIEEDEKKKRQELCLFVSTSARYFTLASKKQLERNGCFVVYAKNEKSFDLLYSLINSSYVYMWWRFLDGGILFSKRILLEIPIDDVMIQRADIVKETIEKMLEKEESFKTYKKNAGKEQESIKFPKEYRQKINGTYFPEFVNELELLHNNFETV